MPDLLDPTTHDAATALGTFIIAAIEHLSAQDAGCCPLCCPQCNALHFYWFTTDYPAIADTAVKAALDGQAPAWIHEGGINWPYLVQFWPAEEKDHAVTCGR